jgi:hypothetical protein
MGGAKATASRFCQNILTWGRCKTKTKTKQAGAPQTVIIVRSREILSKYFDLGGVKQKRKKK